MLNLQKFQDTGATLPSVAIRRKRVHTVCQKKVPSDPGRLVPGRQLLTLLVEAFEGLLQYSISSVHRKILNKQIYFEFEKNMANKSRCTIF